MNPLQVLSPGRVETNTYCGRYRTLLSILSRVEGLEDLGLCFEAEPETVVAAILGPWMSSKLQAEAHHRARLDAIEGELTTLQSLLSSIQSEFLMHIIQRQVSTNYHPSIMPCSMRLLRTGDP